MNFQKARFRHSLLFQYELGGSAAQAHRESHAVLDEECLNERICRGWFARFRFGDLSIEDKPRSGRSVKFDQETLLELVDRNPSLSLREMASELGSNHTTIRRQLVKLGFEQKYGQSVPHNLTEDQKTKRVRACSFLLARRADKEWIKQIVAGDEKWVLYVNHTCKRQWLPKGQETERDPKGHLHHKKCHVVCLLGLFEIIWYELIPYGKTVTARLYSHQLQELANARQTNRPQRSIVYFLHDNAKPHTANLTKKKLKDGLGGSPSRSLFARSGTIRLPFISMFANFFTRNDSMISNI